MEKKFGHFLIEEEIGRGAMGQVYRATDIRTKQIFALKIPNQLSSVDIKRFMREAETMKKLQHSNIIRIHEVGVFEKRPYISMEWIQGRNLEDFYKKRSLTSKQIAKIMVHIGKGVDFAHQKGIIHRDLKPSNIMMMTETEKPVVMDFGLAKHLGDNRKISQTGAIMGTLQYMSPEQAQGKNKQVNEQSDIYSLGAILYELLTDRPPFMNTNSYKLVYDILKCLPIPPKEINPLVPKELENIALKALSKDQKKRYESVQEFIKDLNYFLEGKAVSAKSQFSQQFMRKTKSWSKIFSLSAFIIIFILTITVTLDNSHLKSKNAKLVSRERFLSEKNENALLDKKKLQKQNSDLRDKNETLIQEVAVEQNFNDLVINILRARYEHKIDSYIRAVLFILNNGLKDQKESFYNTVLHHLAYEIDNGQSEENTKNKICSFFKKLAKQDGSNTTVLYYAFVVVKYRKIDFADNALKLCLRTLESSRTKINKKMEADLRYNIGVLFLYIHEYTNSIQYLCEAEKCGYKEFWLNYVKMQNYWLLKDYNNARKEAKRIIQNRDENYPEYVQSDSLLIAKSKSQINIQQISSKLSFLK